MFGDLAGFTSISERMDTEETVALLNRCMSGLAERLTEHHGYVNKFLGDGFLAFWSAFGDQPEQADLACHAAVECQAFMRTINQQAAVGMPQLGLRIGIATGEALVGDCGAPPRLNDYTVIGDVANLAARLESANKQFGTSILLDGRTQSLIQSSDLPLCEIGPVQVVGREGVVHIWTLVADSFPPESIEAASTLATAIRSGDRTTARSALETLERLEGTSRRTQLLAEIVRDTPDPMPRALRLREK
jgi:adenylate cyclase